jgi:broad specificity phosphatase PhoE
MRLFLVRHGESANNARDESQRVHDPGLTELGAEQVEFLGPWFASVSPDVLITSPFLRALKTMVPIQRATGLHPVVWRDLHEVGGCVSGYPAIGHVGEAGLTAEEIIEQFPSCDVEGLIGELGWWGGKPYEGAADIAVRVQRIVERTLAEFGDTDLKVVYVMHADFKRELLCGFCAEHSFSRSDYGPLHNAGVTELTLTRTTSRLDSYNNIGHLPYGLKSSEGVY